MSGTNVFNSKAGTSPPSRVMRGNAAARVWRLARKELREILRDRRTIITLVLMPIIVYPLLSIAFQRFLVTSLRPPGDEIVRIGAGTEEQVAYVRAMLEAGDEIIRERIRRKSTQPSYADEADAASRAAEEDKLTPQFFVVEDPRPAIAAGVLDVSIRVIPRTDRPPLPDGRPSVIFEITSREGDPLGQRVLRQVERRVGVVNELNLQARLRQRGDPGSVPVRVERAVVAAAGSAGSSLKTLVPLILVLMTITGAVYPAIDLTAGERERGTLEMLVAAPVSRLELMLGKYVAVLTVALLTASANLTAMTVTILSMGLGKLVLGDAGLTPIVVLQVFGLLMLLAAFFSAILLALTSFARSFKEAQAYLIPLMMVCIAPGLLSLTPDLELNGLLAVTPLVNIVLLARDLFAGTPTSPILAAVTIGSTLLFALATLGLAARVFGTDAILYGSQGNWSDLWRSGGASLDTASVSSAVLCLALLFPALFLMNNILAQLTQERIEWLLGLGGLAQVILFAGFPLLAARMGRVAILSAFGLRGAAWPTYWGAFIMGLSLWPAAYQLMMLLNQLGVAAIDPGKMQAVAAKVEEFRTVSPLLVVLAFGLLPAISEELFFRGYLFGALRARLSGLATIVTTGAVFGLFHLIATDSLALERLVPTTAIGLALGWIRHKTNSVFPGMVLHALHNSLLLLVAYYQPGISAYLGLEETTQLYLPWTWVVAGAASAAVAVLLIVLATPIPSEPDPARREVVDTTR